MEQILARLGAVNPLVWVVMAIAMALGFGAQWLAARMKVPEEKRLKVVIALKSGALLLTILIFILVITTM